MDELPRTPNLAPYRDRSPELDTDNEPRLRAPACVEPHARDAVDAEPGMPEAAAVSFISSARATAPR